MRALFVVVFLVLLWVLLFAQNIIRPFNILLHLLLGDVDDGHGEAIVQFFDLFFDLIHFLSGLLRQLDLLAGFLFTLQTIIEVSFALRFRSGFLKLLLGLLELREQFHVLLLELLNLLRFVGVLVARYGGIVPLLLIFLFILIFFECRYFLLQVVNFGLAIIYLNHFV